MLVYAYFIWANHLLMANCVLFLGEDDSTLSIS